jgi:glutathione S-transferase
MIILHHLNKSRSKRIIWLLEELGVEYEIRAYQRDAKTSLSPPELRAVHALGKAPVLEDNGKSIIESGAISEYLIARYGAGRLAPEVDSDDYIDYLQWMHYAESSCILPILMRMYLKMDGCETNFLADYVQQEVEDVVNYFNNQLEGKTYLVGEQLSGADIMMSFIVDILERSGELAAYPNIERYGKTLATHEAFKVAEEKEKALDESA